MNYKAFFNSEIHNLKLLQEVETTKRKRENKIRNLSETEIKWSIFTYQFSFLLTKKIYFKHLQPLEDRIVAGYLDNEERRRFIVSIENQIKSNTIIQSTSRSVELDKVNEAIGLTNEEVIENYSRFQRSFFYPSDSKLADFINAF